MEMSWNGLIQNRPTFPRKKKRCSQTKHRGRAAWVFSTFTLQVLTALLQQWSAFLDFSGDGLLYDGKSGLFWTKYQNVFMNNDIKVHDSCIKMPSIWILSVFDHDHYIYRMERKCWFPCDVIFTPSCLLGLMQLDHRKGHGENVNRAWLGMACQMLQCYDVTPADLQTSK